MTQRSNTLETQHINQENHPEQQNWVKEIQSTQNIQDLEEIRIRLLGKTGIVTQLLKELGSLSPEDRKERGAQINQLKLHLAQGIETQKEKLQEQALEARLQQESIDLTLSPRPELVGAIHPISRTFQEIISYFSNFGFEVAYGPDIEDEEYNFNALNIPEHHPARQSHDTFYFEDPKGHEKNKRLLRTHTSPVQIRIMKSKKPPIRILAPGRVYRCDYDATHTPMFHQVEGLVIDKGIHFGHFKGCIIDFCKTFFGLDDLKIRFRPSFFPFTEPSAEVDIGCDRRQGQMTLLGEKDMQKAQIKTPDWLEVMGCGMVHPQVLLNCGVDPEEYQGFAFGFGVDRFAMLKYSIPDSRAMYESDIRWLKHYGFNPFSNF